MEKWLIQIVMPRRVGIGPFDHIVKHSLREGQDARGMENIFTGTNFQKQG